MKRLFALICLIPLVSACTMTDKFTDALMGKNEDDLAAAAAPAGPVISCPETGMMMDATEMPIFVDGQGKPQAADIAAIAYTGNIRGGCNFDTPGQAEMELKLTFSVRKGPRGQGLEKMHLPYFIAILSPDESVLQRKAFSTKVDFDNEETASTTEEHDLRVPVPSREEAGKYKVVAGFQLTPEQLAFVREHKDDPAKIKTNDAKGK